MKTMLDLAKECIARNIELGTATAIGAPAIRQAVQRQRDRTAQDPAVATLVSHFAVALSAALQPNVPYELRAQMISGTMLQVLMEWEDINQEFDKQLKNHAV